MKRVYVIAREAIMSRLNEAITDDYCLYALNGIKYSRVISIDDAANTDDIKRVLIDELEQTEPHFGDATYELKVFDGEK